MLCPKCPGMLEPWYWCDGGAIGIRCPSCKEEWVSDIAARLIDQAARAAEIAACNAAEFPKDAITKEEQYRLDAEMIADMKTGALK